MHTIILSLRNVAYSFNSDFNIILGIKLFSLSVLSLVLISCGGGGGGGDTTPSAPVDSLTLHSSNQAASNQFGETVVQLPNGNVIVVAPNDSSEAENGGAVYLYDPSSATPINSIFGDTENDQLGGDGITVLSNGHFVIVSKFDDENGITNAGSVRLVNGKTGEQIGTALVGDVAGDFLGSNGITVLSNDNFVIVSESDNENGITDAGSVRLVNGKTGAQIGTALAGDAVADFLGTSGITALSNGHFVIASKLDNENSTTGAGSVRLVNGETGAQIGTALVGDVENDQLGSGSITALSNGHFVIASEFDDEDGITDAGSVRLVNGETGDEIGTALVGDVANDKLGSSGITALGNGHFVIASEFDDNGSITDAGSVRLVNGITGIEINALVGDVVDDKLGGLFHGDNSITALSNNNFVVASAFDDENNVTNAGSVRLVNGETGIEIKALVGDVENDFLGDNGITALSNNDNNNFVVVSALDDENDVSNAGSVRLVNGKTGDEIKALVGDVENDNLGSSGVTALSNGHFVIASAFDDENNVSNAGSVRLVNGETGEQIGTALVGDEENDKLGNNNVTALSNDNFVIVSALDDEGGIINAGSVRLVDGTTGVQIGDAVVGDTANDIENAQVIAPKSGDYYILGLPKADVDGSVDAGSVRIVVPQ